MTQLVFIENGKTVTDSLIIAEVFGKEHKNVIRDIENLECSEEFNRLNFERIYYTDSRNRLKPKYIITQDGFSFLVMGYTGKEAARFKEMYIREFNRMREQMNNLPSNPLKALMQATHNLLASQELIVERLDEVEDKVDRQITLEQGEQRRVQIAVSTRIYDLESNPEERSPLFRELYRELKNRWGVSSYRDLLRKDLGDVLAYINAWVPRKG